MTTSHRFLTEDEYRRFCPRVRFNWGFHDARSEASRGRARTIDLTRPSCEANIGPNHDAFFARGYAAGLADFAAHGDRETTSTDAWCAFTHAATPEEFELLSRFHDDDHLVA